ncbi:MAG: GNAT family N-acetyltransferase [Longimicrobiales bacterium]
MGEPRIIRETKRLRLREMVEEDAPFILELLNEPSFLRFIGDKGVRTLDDARAYIIGGPVASYLANGHGLYHVELKATRAAIGMSGLVKRPTLEHPDLGFAFLPAYWSQGYALEAARAVMDLADNELKIPTVIAIASPDNVASAKLLNHVGLVYAEMISTTGGEPDLALFRRAAPQP